MVFFATSNPFIVLIIFLGINFILLLTLILKRPILSKKNIIYDIVIELLLNGIISCALILNIFDNKKMYTNLNVRIILGKIIISLEIAIFGFIVIGQIVNFIWRKIDFD